MLNKYVFTSVTEAIDAAVRAFKSFEKLGISSREDIIINLRSVLESNLEKIAKMTYEETNFGILRDKKIKLKVAIEQTPGTEDLNTEAITKDKSLTLFERSAYGVVCDILPSNNPTATLINNVISLLSSGNSVVLCPHPRAIGVSKYLTKIISDTIFKISGIENLVVTLDNISLNNVNEIMHHPDIDMIISTGGSDVAKEVIKCKKKIIAAGPSNPTFIIDETADIKKAARCIVKSVSFDNNLMCVTEKNLIVVREVYNKFISELEKEGAFNINDFSRMIKLSKVLLNEDLKPNKMYGGVDANNIIDIAKLKRNKDYKIITVTVPKIHPFVTEELLMPIVPIVVVDDFEMAIDYAIEAERGYKHTAGIYSNDLDRLNFAAKKLQTSVFVKNGSALDAIGFSDNTPAAFTIANITGEGTITAKDLTRKRRCVLIDAFSIR